jgi:phosphatidylserine decarboxylase
MWRSGAKQLASSSPILPGGLQRCRTAGAAAAAAFARPLAARPGLGRCSTSVILCSSSTRGSALTRSTPTPFAPKRYSANKTSNGNENSNSAGQQQHEPIRLNALGKQTPEEAAKPLRHNGDKKQRSTTRRLIKYTLLGAVVGAGVATIAFLNQSEPATARQMRILTALPSRGLSALWGKVNDVELPLWFRTQLFQLWTWMYDCKLDEMRDPLESYKNLGEFFTRHLKEGVRPMGDGMVSPVDGRVLIFGEIKDSQVEQIKGLTYELESLLGDTQLHLKVQDKNEAQGRPDKKLYHVVIYLAPGDYHGIHTPVDMTVTHRRHFPGHLFPVAPTVVNLIKGLFAMNERVALLGKWEHGFYSLIPVGATNVGSIALTIEEGFRTNLSTHKVGRGDGEQNFYERIYTQPIKLAKGDEVRA